MGINLNASRALMFLVAALLGAVTFGCASDRATLNRVTLNYHDRIVPPPFLGVQPVLDGSINNVSGYFVIDTGAMGTALTQSAIQRCGLSALPSKAFAVGIGGRMTMTEATNVTIRLAQDYTMHWQRIPVLPQMSSSSETTNDSFLGILGYQTLVALHAVIDVNNKTITLSK